MTLVHGAVVFRVAVVASGSDGTKSPRSQRAASDFEIANPPNNAGRATFFSVFDELLLRYPRARYHSVEIAEFLARQYVCNPFGLRSSEIKPNGCSKSTC